MTNTQREYLTLNRPRILEAWMRGKRYDSLFVIAQLLNLDSHRELYSVSWLSSHGPSKLYSLNGALAFIEWCEANCDHDTRELVHAIYTYICAGY